MIFRTQDVWEVKDPGLAVLSPKGCRTYKMFEVAINFPFFILKILVREDDEVLSWKTLLVYDVDEAIFLTKAEFVEQARISLVYTPWTESGKHEFGEVTRIHKGKDSQGCWTFEFVLADGKTYRDFSSETGELSEFEELYTTNA